MSEDAEAPNGGRGPNAKGVVVAMAILTVVSVGAGGGLAFMVHTRAEKSKEQASTATQGQAPESKLAVRVLPTILARISGQQAPWLRLNLSIVTPKNLPEADRFAELVTQDIHAFVSTLKSDQFVGATNFAILRSDLQEILRIRSKGVATEIFVRGLLLE